MKIDQLSDQAFSGSTDVRPGKIGAQAQSLCRPWFRSTDPVTTRLVPSLEGDHRKNLPAATSCAEQSPLFPARRSVSRRASASNGNAQEERHQQRAKRGFARDVAQDAQRPAGLAARFDRTADTVDRLCRHRSHDAWRQIRTSPPDTSGNSSGKAFSKQSKTCRQLAEVPI